MADVVLILDGRAHEIVPGLSLADAADRYHPDIVARMVEAAAGSVAPGDVWDGAAFSTPPVIVQPPTADDVRAEASRRMQVLLGARDADHLSVIISNAQRESARLYAIRLGIPGVVAGREWTEAEARRAAELYVADQAIEAIRAASNAMESAPPADFAADGHWEASPAVPQPAPALAVQQLLIGLVMHGVLVPDDVLAYGDRGALPVLFHSALARLAPDAFLPASDLLAAGGPIPPGAPFVAALAAELDLSADDLAALWAVCAGVPQQQGAA